MPTLTRFGVIGAVFALLTAGVLSFGVPASAQTTPTELDLVVTGAASGGGPHVKVWSSGGSFTGNQWMAYDPGFHGGVDVAMGDLDGDGLDEIITAPGPGGGPHIKVFDVDGRTADDVPGPLVEFMAYAPAMTAGVNVGVADVDGDGDDEIITGPGPGVPAHIKAFDIDDTIKHATEVASFIAGSVNDRGGADVSGAWRGPDDEAQAIVVASGRGGTGNVSLWNRFGQQQGASFKPYPGSTAGARVNSADIDGDGRDEIVTGPGAGGPPQVKTFASGPATLGANVGSMSFLAYPSGFTGGVDVGSFYESADVDVVSILTGAGPGGGPHVKRFDPPNHAEQPGWMAYDPGFAGGVHVDGGLLVFGGGSSTTTG